MADAPYFWNKGTTGRMFQNNKSLCLYITLQSSYLEWLKYKTVKPQKCGN